MEQFKAIWIARDEDTNMRKPVEIVDISLDDLMDGDVTVKIEHSTVNYKDGLAITGASPVVRRFPMIPGIDASGEVVASDSPAFAIGDKVVLNGWGCGETHMGGFAEFARFRSDWLIHKPRGLTGAQCMAIGTAGYTAILCIMALERHGITPDRGPILVTGAAGGVGSIAIALLAKLGYHVIASTGRTSEEAYLKSLGAAEIIDRNELSKTGKSFGKERWAGAIDSVGSTTLANVLAQTCYGGAVAACGLAQGVDLPATVLPFILRGVSLLGVDSVLAPKSIRIEAYERLASDLDLNILQSLSTTIGFNEILPTAKSILAGEIRGRVVVEMP